MDAISQKSNIEWSDEITTTTYINTAILKEQLRVRYAFFKPPKNGLLNVVVDSFVPRLMYSANMYINLLPSYYTLPKTAVAISPWFASILGVKQVPLTDLIAILGYTQKELRLLFKKVRAKKLTMHFIGFGGTSVNTITWLIELSKLLNAPQLFQHINITEPDTLELSNLFRFPIDPRTVQYSIIQNLATSPVHKLEM